MTSTDNDGAGTLLPQRASSSEDTSTPPIRRLRYGIARRYIRYVLAGLLLVLLSFLALTVWLQQSQSRQDLAEAATRQAGFLGAVAPEAVFTRDYLGLETLVRTTTDDSDTTYAIVIDGDGLPMTRFLDRSDGRVVAAVAATPAGTDVLGIADQVLLDNDVREVRRPIISEGVVLGEIRIGYSLQSARDRALEFAVQALGITLLVAVVIAVLTALVFEWQIRRPLIELFSGANSLAAGDLSQRIEVRHDDEIGGVQTAFNTMAAELERSLDAAREAQSAAEVAAQSKGEFLANMSHEIRTPLNAVLGLTDVLLTSDMTADQANMLETVHRSGNSLLSIINDILYLSKIEAGRLELESEPFELRRCLSDVDKLFRLEAQNKGLELNVVVDAALDEVYQGDEQRLRQIIVNLVGNALKFTHQGVIEVLVSASTSNGDHQRLRFEVSDTGVGIPADSIDQLFEPFSQADASTTRKYGGTGLGLAICRRLADLMGGALAVETEVDVGSTFCFVIPLEGLGDAEGQIVGAVEELATVTEAEIHQDLRILIAEDNALNQVVAVRLLERLGYTADIANDGLEAVQMATNAAYDVIFMDVQMPNLDGVGAMHQIRAQLSPEHCPRIIALTANAVEGDREEYLRQGMDDYLSKPVRLLAIKTALEKAEPLQSRVDGPETAMVDD